MTKKLFILLCLAICLSACDRIRTSVFEDDITLPMAQDKADSLFYSLSLEYVRDGMLIPAMEKVNSTIVTQAFDLEEMSGTVEECAGLYRENLIDEYLNENNSTWEDHLKGAFTGKYKGWMNYKLSYYSYRGGAHGLQTEIQIVFDRKTGEMLNEYDILSPDSREAVAQLILANVTNDTAENDAEFMELLEPRFLVPNGNFSVSEDGMTWVFQPYEAGPYALGLIEATVPWDMLKPYLKVK